ncbi:hypothetical protein [uncultured Aquitalea sp.]|uniref:hypothetical protein n=1 Tax=uncultured Aquitalea sp. TaxID=540272 RepID=UPI0025E384F1|nr:hypothetical protein [uncultured Aquitalea sp.]
MTDRQYIEIKGIFCLCPIFRDGTDGDAATETAQRPQKSLRPTSGLAEGGKQKRVR